MYVPRRSIVNLAITGSKKNCFGIPSAGGPRDTDPQAQINKKGETHGISD